jgi:hypothetical protein
MGLRLRERQELDQRRIREATEALRASRRRSAWSLVAEALCEQDIDDLYGYQDWVRNVALAGWTCRDNGYPEPYCELIRHLCFAAERLLQVRGKVGGNPLLAGIQCLARQERYWVRPLETWRPVGKSPERQFAELARHLLARYPVPPVVDQLLFRTQPGVREDWFRRLGDGRNLRLLPGMTAVLTKKMAHLALQAPEDLDFVKAIRQGQVYAMGGGKRLARALFATPMGFHLGTESQESRRLTLIQWLIQQPRLDPAQIRPIYDYTHYRWEREPGFRLAGRSPTALLELIEGWQLELGETSELLRSGRRDYPASGLSPGEWHIGAGLDRTTWRMVEVLNSRDLIAEGKAMRHCVATYDTSLAGGWCSVWSLRTERFGVEQRALTVEVHLSSDQVVQARGKCNRFPNAEEAHILVLWARQNGLCQTYLEQS